MFLKCLLVIVLMAEDFLLWVYGQKDDIRLRHFARWINSSRFMLNIIRDWNTSIRPQLMVMAYSNFLVFQQNNRSEPFPCTPCKVSLTRSLVFLKGSDAIHVWPQPAAILGTAVLVHPWTSQVPLSIANEENLSNLKSTWKGASVVPAGWKLKRCLMRNFLSAVLMNSLMIMSYQCRLKMSIRNGHLMRFDSAGL